MFFVTTLWFCPLFWVWQKKGPLATDRQPATPLAIRHPRSNSPLWRTPKPNLETFKGRCHSEKCRAWWTEYFVMLRGVWGGGIVLILWVLNLLCDFFSSSTYNIPHTKPRRWRQLQNVLKTMLYDGFGWQKMFSSPIPTLFNMKTSHESFKNCLYTSSKLWVGAGLCYKKKHNKNAQGEESRILIGQLEKISGPFWRKLNTFDKN